jgi:hypothetical protein
MTRQAESKIVRLRTIGEECDRTHPPRHPGPPTPGLRASGDTV